jgi:hypothetical protein
MIRHLLAAVAVVLAAGAQPSTQTINYAGIHCDAGTSSRGTRSVVCGRIDHRGYEVLLSRAHLAVAHCSSATGVCRFVLIRPNR